METNELRGRGRERRQFDVVQPTVFVDRTEHCGVEVKLRDALIRRPVIDAAHGMRVMLRDKNITHHAAQHLQRCAPREVDIVCQFRQAFWYVMWWIGVLESGFELCVSFAKSKFCFCEIAQAPINESILMHRKAAEVSDPGNDRMIQGVHHGSARGVVDRHQVFEVLHGAFDPTNGEGFVVPYWSFQTYICADTGFIVFMLFCAGCAVCIDVICVFARMDGFAFSSTR